MIKFISKKIFVVGFTAALLTGLLYSVFNAQWEFVFLYLSVIIGFQNYGKYNKEYEQKQRLNNISGLKIKEAEVGDRLKPGHGLLAPGDFHLEINAQGRVKLNKKDRQHGVRPCVDYMMKSIADNFDGDRLLGVILTGMGHDGAEGMSAIVNEGGYGIIESKETALVYGMPSAAAKAEAYHEIKRIDEIGRRITEIVEG